MQPADFTDITALIHNIMNLDKDTLHSLAYAAYLYIMMDRYTHKSSRR